MGKYPPGAGAGKAAALARDGQTPATPCPLGAEGTFEERG